MQKNKVAVTVAFQPQVLDAIYELNSASAAPPSAHVDAFGLTKEDRDALKLPKDCSAHIFKLSRTSRRKANALIKEVMRRAEENRHGIPAESFSHTVNRILIAGLEALKND